MTFVPAFRTKTPNRHLLPKNRAVLAPHRNRGSDGPHHVAYRRKENLRRLPERSASAGRAGPARSPMKPRLWICKTAFILRPTDHRAKRTSPTKPRARKHSPTRRCQTELRLLRKSMPKTPFARSARTRLPFPCLLRMWASATRRTRNRWHALASPLPRSPRRRRSLPPHTLRSY